MTILTCPGSAVWYPPVEDQYPGSPLDVLPVKPWLLNLPDAENDEEEEERAEVDKEIRLVL